MRLLHWMSWNFKKRRLQCYWGRSYQTFLTAFKIENNVPEVIISCHTTRIGGYFIEGHVPVRDIKRLLRDRPDALGLVMPEMPYRSPGMGPDEEREAYDVFVVGKDDNIEVFQRYPQVGKAA